VAARIFGLLAATHINVDMIVQNVSHEERADMSFTVGHGDLERAIEVCKGLAAELGATEVLGDHNVAKVSVVGVGMRSNFGIAGKMFQTLADAGINIQMISTSEIKISAVVDADSGEQALRVLHDAFGLGDTPDIVEEM